MKINSSFINKDFEFMVSGHELLLLSEGKITSFDHLPISILEVIREDMEKNPEALLALNQMEIYDEIERMKQYIKCRYGNFDEKADISTDGITETEYFECGKRGLCKYEGKLCQHVKAENGYLTKREAEIIKHIANGDLPNKQIADELCISENTLNTHIQNISSKIGCNTKNGIAQFYWTKIY